MLAKKGWPLVGAAVGLTIGGQEGAVVGDVVGGVIDPVVPTPSSVVSRIAVDLGAERLQVIAGRAMARVEGEGRQLVHNVLQRAFREAFQQAVHDTGGIFCFPEQWRHTGRGTAEDQERFVYPASHLQEHDAELAKRVCQALQGLSQSVVSHRQFDVMQESVLLTN